MAPIWLFCSLAQKLYIITRHMIQFLIITAADSPLKLFETLVLLWVIILDNISCISGSVFNIYLI